MALARKAVKNFLRQCLSFWYLFCLDMYQVLPEIESSDVLGGRNRSEPVRLRAVEQGEGMASIV